MWDGEKIHKLDKFRSQGNIKIEVTMNNVSHPVLHQNSWLDWKECESCSNMMFEPTALRSQWMGCLGCYLQRPLTNAMVTLKL